MYNISKGINKFNSNQCKLFIIRTGNLDVEVLLKYFSKYRKT